MGVISAKFSYDFPTFRFQTCFHYRFGQCLSYKRFLAVNYKASERMANHIVKRVKMWTKQVSKLRVLALSLASFAALGMFYSLAPDNEWMQKAEDSIMLVDWSGFGPEKGLYNFTVVTAMIDIGRGDWSSQARSYSEYLLYMQRVLRLDVNIVVYVEPKGKPFIEWMRRGRENHTTIVTLTIQELPYYQLRDRMAEIMSSEAYKADNELVANKLCEASSPEYDIVQLSKLYLMDRTVTLNPFNSTYFIWMDGGYGKRENIHPPDGIWKPKGLFEYADRMTFLERKPGVAAFANVRHKIHKMSINIMPGGFFAGGGPVIRELYHMQKQGLSVWMKEGIIDDDQTMYMQLYFQKPSLFRLVPGDWYDAFKLFNAHIST